MKYKRLEKLVIMLLVAVICVSGYKIVTYYYEANKQAEQFNELTGKIEAVEGENSTEKTGKKVVLKKYKKLYEENPDFIGWIKIEGTRINYPVMQTQEKYDFYLDHNFKKSYSIFGVPFLGESCDAFKPSKNIIIYGHNMKNGSMFSDLNKYKEEEFYKKHKKIKFDTLEKEGTYQVVFAFVTEVNTSEELKYYEFIDCQDEELFNKYIGKFKKESFYESDNSLEFSDKFITLSTCENSGENSRMVVIAKREGK